MLLSNVLLQIMDSVYKLNQTARNLNVGIILYILILSNYDIMFFLLDICINI